MHRSSERAFRSRPLVLVLAAAGACGAAPVLGQTVRYQVVDLGQASGAAPAAVSDDGRIVGTYFNTGGQRRSFLWQDGAGGDIGTLGGIAQAFDVNSAGVAVGYSVDAQGRQLAFRLENGVMTALPNLNGGVHASAAAINSAGWIAGMSQRRVGNEVLQRAALWQDGVPIDLGDLGGVYAEAFDLNQSGRVVGWAWNAAWRQRAFLWTPGGSGMTDLGTLGGLSAAAHGINDAGHVVGIADRAEARQGTGPFVAVLLVPLALCATDLNEDGAVTSTDIAAFLTRWLDSVTTGAPGGDYNADGQTNSGDISAYLTAWLDQVGGC